MEVLNFKEYHEKSTKDNDYFVQFSDVSFYSNESLESIKNNYKGVSFNVYNCNWKSDNYMKDPYSYVITNKDVYEKYATSTTVEPNHYSFSLLGLKKNGNWIEKHYKNGTSFIRSHSCGIVYAYTNKGVAKRSESGLWSVGEGKNALEVDCVPETLMSLAKQLDSCKHKGFYDDVVDILVAEGLNRAFI